MSRPIPRRPLLALLASLSLVATFLAGHPGSASAASPAPVKVVITGLTSSVLAPDGTPGAAIPSLLVRAGDPFTVDVEFRDASGNLASFNKDTAFALTATTPAGALQQTTAVAHKGLQTEHLSVTVASVVNQVTISVDLADARAARTFAEGLTTRFDVLSEIQLKEHADQPSFVAGIGGQQDCTSATPSAAVCGTLMLPQGAASSQALMSIGACDAGTAGVPAYAPCRTRQQAAGSVVQVLADLTTTGTDHSGQPVETPIYTKNSPATLLMRCDKVLCGSGSIQSTTLYVSLAGNLTLTQADPCPAKNTMADPLKPCIDYVQSTRDNAGDTLLYLLFTRDARVSVG